MYCPTWFWRAKVWASVPVSKCQKQVTSPWAGDLFAQNAENMVPFGSTQANKSFNNSVVSKAPKARHYSGSESLDYRVKAAVCQNNLGHNCVATVRLSKKVISAPGLLHVSTNQQP